MPKFGFVIAACLALVARDRVRRPRRLAAARCRARQHPAEAIDGVRSVLRVLVLFALVTPFWSLFDQKASTWVLQANAMTKPSWFQSSQMQALNPAARHAAHPVQQPRPLSRARRASATN